MAGEHGSAAGAGVQTELLAVSCSFSRSSESRGAAPAAQPVWHAPPWLTGDARGRTKAQVIRAA